MTSLENQVPVAPAHHFHSDKEPLPGAKGGQPTIDYSAENMDRLPNQDFIPPGTTGMTHHDTHGPSHIGAHKPAAGAFGHEEQPGPFGGTTGHGPTTHMTHPAPGHPQKKATIGDKIVGKTEELAGKIAHNPEMQEKGAIRAQVGKQ
jgi:hypothetical protein